MHTVGQLLRQWRRHRRLSQLDLALEADVSARHVSLVETGKSKPSAAMVLRLAEHLDVPLRERNRLLLAAGFAPRYGERPLDGEALSVPRQAMERVLAAHEPYPAMVLDRRWNVVLRNRAADPFFAYIDPDLLRPPLNLVRLGMDPRGLAGLVANLEEVRAGLRARIMRQLSAAPDPELAALYEELLASPSPDGTSELPPARVDPVLPMVFDLGGRELRLFSTTTTFGSPLDVTLAEVTIEAYYPADEQSAAFFTESTPDSP